jgi:hypothetical protein
VGESTVAEFTYESGIDTGGGGIELGGAFVVRDRVLGRWFGFIA